MAYKKEVTMKEATITKSVLDQLKNKTYTCPVCKKQIYASDKFEFNKTKRNTYVFMHRDCVILWK